MFSVYENIFTTKIKRITVCHGHVRKDTRLSARTHVWIPEKPGNEVMLCQFPFGQLPTLLTLTKWELTKWEVGKVGSWQSGN